MPGDRCHTRETYDGEGSEKLLDQWAYGIQLATPYNRGRA